MDSISREIALFVAPRALLTPFKGQPFFLFDEKPVSLVKRFVFGQHSCQARDEGIFTFERSWGDRHLSTIKLGRINYRSLGTAAVAFQEAPPVGATVTTVVNTAGALNLDTEVTYSACGRQWLLVPLEIVNGVQLLLAGATGDLFAPAPPSTKVLAHLMVGTYPTFTQASWQTSLDGSVFSRQVNALQRAGEHFPAIQWIVGAAASTSPLLFRTLQSRVWALGEYHRVHRDISPLAFYGDVNLWSPAVAKWLLTLSPRQFVYQRSVLPFAPPDHLFLEPIVLMKLQGGDDPQLRFKLPSSLFNKLCGQLQSARDQLTRVLGVSSAASTAYRIRLSDYSDAGAEAPIVTEAQAMPISPEFRYAPQGAQEPARPDTSSVGSVLDEVALFESSGWRYSESGCST